MTSGKFSRIDDSNHAILHRHYYAVLMSLSLIYYLSSSHTVSIDPNHSIKRLIALTIPSDS